VSRFSYRLHGHAFAAPELRPGSVPDEQRRIGHDLVRGVENVLAARTNDVFSIFALLELTS
jgi:hypothetical protein